MHAAGAALPDNFKPGKRRFRHAGVCLQIYHTIGRKAGGQPRPVISGQTLAKRRIEKNHVETPRCPDQKLQRIALLYRQTVGAEPRRIFAQRAPRGWIALDHRDSRRAARQRLEPERAGAGEKIKTGSARKILPQPVEERLPHAIGRRPKARRIGKAQNAASPFAADYPHGVTARGSHRQPPFRIPYLPRCHVKPNPAACRMNRSRRRFPHPQSFPAAGVFGFEADNIVRYLSAF